ncbi:MAG: CapA family protein [Prevotellaceae bacterium]|jgi:poly-gamma-glutamate synthesis protein (capsule biosynthesis protein)|nr:CapA family protein [Prevotellaceae bacterium]
MGYLLRKLLTLVLALFCSAITAAGDTVCRCGDDNSITLIFAGDVMQHSPQFNGARRADGVYDFEPCFRLIKDEIAAADLAIANLEVPLAGKPYSGYPAFSGPDEIAIDLKKTGFDVLVTANNHSCDRGAKGVERTVKMLDSFGIAHTGMFRSKQERAERYPLIVTVKNFKIAVLNYTYSLNGMSAGAMLVNMIDSVQIIEDIEAARLSSPDIIIAFMHWGDEYKRYPNDEQKDLTDMFFRNGVNLVIGAHPHVIQSMEKRYLANGRCDKLVAYSLGNFVSNQPFLNTDGGAVLKVNMLKDDTGVRIAWAGYNLIWVYKPKENGKTRHYILPVADYENAPEKLNATFQKNIQRFANNARTLLNKENIGIGEYRILPPRRKVELLQRIEMKSVKVELH